MGDDLTLHLPFTDDSESFALGFEAGAVYGQMFAAEPVIEQLIHGANAEMVIRMCETEGYAFSGGVLPASDEWIDVRLVRKADS